MEVVRAVDEERSASRVGVLRHELRVRERGAEREHERNGERDPDRAAHLAAHLAHKGVDAGADDEEQKHPTADRAPKWTFSIEWRRRS